MEVLYLDRLIAVNFLIDYCLLLAAGRVCGACLRRWRFALAALLGAAYAGLGVLPGWGWLLHPAMKIALGCLMALIAFGGEAGLARCTAVFFAVAALFGGGVYAASLLAGADPLRGSVAPLTLRVFALSFAVCYTAVALLFRRRAKQNVRVVRPVTVRFGGRETHIPGWRDSGNDLHDPVTGTAAAVADRRALEPLLPSLPDDPVAAFEQLRGRRAFRLLPYRAVGANGLLLAFRPDEIEVDGKKEDLLIALSPTPVGEGGAQIILPE